MTHALAGFVGVWAGVLAWRPLAASFRLNQKTADAVSIEKAIPGEGQRSPRIVCDPRKRRVVAGALATGHLLQGDLCRLAACGSGV